MDLRIRPDQPIRLNILESPARTLEARMIALSGRRSQIQAADAVVPGAAVRIDLDDSLLLGEVFNCRAAEQGYILDVEVKEAIPSLSDLARLVAAVMNEGRTETVAPSRAHVVSASRRHNNTKKEVALSDHP